MLAVLVVLVLAALPGLSYSLPVGAAIVVLMLAVGVSYRRRAYIVASEDSAASPA